VAVTVTSLTVVMTVFMFLTDLKIIEEFPAGRRSISRWSISGGSIHVTVVLATMVESTTSLTVMMVVVLTDFEIVNKLSAGGNLTNGVRNDRCDGSSSKNECNGKFDLNHVEYRNV
jgi:hypothetical protein